MSASQKYYSTRSSQSTLSFEEAVLQGLAPDGGLYIPTRIADAPKDFDSQWRSLSFAELALEILSLYIDPAEIPRDDLKKLVDRSYSTFRHKDVTPVTKLRDGLSVLELFHGPTYAFKDVALQFVGNLFEYFLQRRNAGKADSDPSREKITVIGATSGDTGSAAIYGLRSKKDIAVYILYPRGRLSLTQENQMASVLDDNVHTVSVAGTFDDCQDLVKQAFADKELNSQFKLGAVNSINWARILAQMTYYFWAYFRVTDADPKADVRFVVPTGNFGDVLAGFYAKRMGLPVAELVVATNANDILHRFFASGDYSKFEKPGAEPIVHATLSPAMDILVSSNFERLLWYLCRENLVDSDEKAGAQVADWMNQLKSNGHFSVPSAVLNAACKEFSSNHTSDAETTETIKSVYESVCPKYIVDPHTAVAVCAAIKRQSADPDHAYVALSTAHPAKFADAVDGALSSFQGYSFQDILPEDFKQLATMPTKKLFADTVDLETIKAFIRQFEHI